MKKTLSTFAFLLFTFYLSFAQIDMGLPAATGKGGAANGIAKDWECIGINPANLGWKNNYDFSLSGLIVGMSVQSRALDYNQLMKAVQNSTDTFTAADKKAFADLFTCEDGLNMQTNINWLTLSFKVPKIGGFAFNIRDRAFGHVTLNKNTADILFNGMNAAIFKDTMKLLTTPISQIIDGSKIGYTHYREMNLAYGTKLFGFGGTSDSSAVSFYGGIGVKYIWGLDNMELYVDNAVLQGHTAMSSSAVKYGTIKGFTPETPSGLFPASGSGTGLDLGLGVGIGKLKVTFSAVDMGSITWDKNVLVAKDTLMPKPSQFSYGGLNSWNLAEQGNHMFNDAGIIKFKPGPAYKTSLPAMFRAGVGYQVTKRFVAGADLVMPMSDNPANLQHAFYALGAEVGLANNLFISLGVAGNTNYGFAMPFGITLAHFFKVCELRVATNDILTYISPGKNPNISFSLSFFRINYTRK